MADPPRNLQKEVLEILNLPPDARVIDLGCGDGGALLHLRGQYPDAELHGIDTNNTSIKTEAAVRAKGIKPITFIQSRVEDIIPHVPDAHFDAILCFFSAYFFEDIENTLAHIQRATKPGGYGSIFYNGN